jgi:hypothetical protein
LRLVSWDPNGPSNTVYRAYTHTEPLFELSAPEDTEPRFDTGTAAGSSNATVADHENAVETRISDLQTHDVLKPAKIHELHWGYKHRDWIDTVDVSSTLDTIKQSLDHWAKEQADVGPGGMPFGNKWKEWGLLGWAYDEVHQQFLNNGWLSEDLPDHPNAPITRREAYTDFFYNALDYRAGNRRLFTNQAMYTGITLVFANRALRTLDANDGDGENLAWDEETEERYMYEAFGVKPLSDFDDRQPSHAEYLTDSYKVMTEAGITKEVAYDAGYGGTIQHILGRVLQDIDDSLLRDRFRASVKARGELRWWVEDATSTDRLAAQDGVLATRGSRYPGFTFHPGTWQGYGPRPFHNFYELGDDVSQRWAELADAHGTFPEADPSADAVSTIRLIKGKRALNDASSTSDYTVPANRERHVFGDEDWGIVNIVDGDHRIIAHLGWGGWTGGNPDGLTGGALFHYHGPRMDRIGTAKLTRMEYPSNGETWTYPDAINRVDGQGQTYTRYLPWQDAEIEVHQYLRGKSYPQTAQPSGDSWPGVSDNAGQTHRMAAIGMHYRETRIGPYKIGMNATSARSRGWGPGKDYDMAVPDGTVIDVETGEEITSSTVTVSERETRVLKVV